MTTEPILVNSPPVWFTIGNEIRIQPISDFDFAVFNGLAWDSSVVNAIDATLLACIIDAASQGVAEDELLEQTSRKLDLKRDPMFVKYSQEALAQMALVGLICKEVTVEDR
ncbi:MAG TPA: hypothetical protein DEF45_18265 [Rhodopirellula sp.]|nr:hypothetical protein [Rhodopirellula sp.]